MLEIPVINVVGSRCRPEEEAKFNKWYDEVHIPMLMKFKNMLAVARFKILKENPDYPTYLAIYQFLNKESYEAYEKSPELAKALAETKVSWPNGLDRMWRVQYEHLRDWQGEVKGAGRGKPLLHIVGARPKPEDEIRFNKWYDQTHVPWLMKTGVIKEAVRYKILKDSKDYPQYLAVYYFQSKKAFETFSDHPERLAAVKELQESWPDGIGTTWRVQYQMLKSWSK